MSQLGAAAKQPLNHAASPTASPSRDIAELPPYLRRHVHLGFNQDDIAALLSSIDSSQGASSSSTTRLAHLPAELLLHIVEYVPVAHILDWRLVCRGFRDAIDGQVLYQQLRRTKLVGYLGSRHERPMDILDDEQYEKIHLVQARFQQIEKGPEADAKDTANRNKPIWSSKYAVFSIDDTWYAHFHNIGGAASRQGDTIEDADAQWMITLDQLELCRPEDGFGTLRWCIWLDDAVLDLDFPVEVGRLHFDVDVNLNKRRIRVAWKDMLFRFLKTERALRILLDEKRNETFTFSHSEDCLRLLRRMRLAASLNPADKLDRHTRWSLRLLHPLFGRAGNHTHATTLETTEDDALHMLLLLRRTASMTARQVKYLSTLATDYRAMESQLRLLDDAFAEFKSYLSMPGFQMNILLPAMITNAAHVPRNPIAWPDELRVKIETQVARWKAQRATVDSLTTMLEASNEAMGVPDDSFDELGSDF